MTDKDREAVNKWLANGNKIEVCKEGARTEDLVFTWGAKKKKKKPAKAKKGRILDIEVK